MKQRLGIILCLFVLLAVGCGTKQAAPPVAPTTLPSLTGNWQIQSAAPAPGSLAGSVLLLGALQNTGAQVTGTFRFSNLAQFGLGGCALNQVITVSGTVNASGNLNLTSAPVADGSIVTAQLLLPTVLTNFATGTIAVSGKTCAFASAPAIAGEIASVSGTFTGPLAPSATAPPTAPPGSATLTLAQNSAPAADGEYPVTGSLAYTFGTCVGNAAVSGTVSGAGLTLTATTASPQLLPNVRINGTVAPTASSVTLGELFFGSFSCGTDPLASAGYTGTLARQ